MKVTTATTSSIVLVLGTLAARPASKEPTSTPASSIQANALPARVELPGSSVELPLLFEEGQPVVEVRLQGKGPFRFWFDTGAGGQGVLSSKLVRKLSFEKVGTRTLNDPTGLNARQGDVLAVPELSLGSAVFRDLRMVALPPSAKPPWERKGLDGIIGFDLFANVLLTLDYPAKKIRLERGELPSAPDVLPFNEPNGVPRIHVQLGALDFEADIDSGSMGSFGISAELGNQVPWATEPSVIGKIRTAFNEAEIRAGRSKEPLRIGAAELPLPEIQISPLFAGRQANLGSKILRRFKIIFDSAHGRVRFVGPVDSSSLLAGAERPARKNYGMVLLTGEDGAVTVDRVESGSAAETCGLRAGDRILRVGEKAIGEIPEEDRMEALGATPLRLGVEREGKRVDLELKLE